MLFENLRLPGQYYDTETGLHYNWHRYYDPSTGRYLTPDPIGLAGGINPFLYANANPINYIDPLGLIWETTEQDYRGAKNWARGALMYAGELIRAGQLVLPSSDSFVGAEKTVTQTWAPDPENPERDSEYPIGLTRTFDQTYKKIIRGPNDLTNNFPDPYYYQWAPYVHDRTYDPVPGGAKYSDPRPSISNKCP